MQSNCLAQTYLAKCGKTLTKRTHFILRRKTYFYNKMNSLAFLKTLKHIKFFIHTKIMLCSNHQQEVIQREENNLPTHKRDYNDLNLLYMCRYITQVIL